MSEAANAANIINDKAGTDAPALAIVLGSGLGDLADQVVDPVRIWFEDLPGFPRSGVSGHSGALILGQLNGARVALLAGRVHYYEHGDPAAMRVPLETLCELGCNVLALSNAAGSTRHDMPPGSLMQITDHINWSGRNPLIGVQGDKRFVDLGDAYDLQLAQQMKAVANAQKIDLHRGVYAWFSGPTFETPAEIKAIAMLGADAIGMSTVPETILARYLGMRVVAVSMITNMAAGMSAEKLSHAHTKREADKAKAGFIDLYAGFAETFA